MVGHQEFKIGKLLG